MKYNVTISFSYEVEAENEDDAEIKAYQYINTTLIPDSFEVECLENN